MAISFVNVGTIAHADSGNITPALPASIASGDILVLVIGAADNVTVTLPAAYTKKIELNSSTNCRLTVAWARATGSDSAPLVTHAAGNEIFGVIGAYRGCKSSGDPFTDAQSQANAGVTTTNTAPTITPLNGDMVIFASAVGEGGTNNGNAQSLSGWSGANPTLVERADYNDQGLGANLCPGGFADGLSTGGATGSRTVTLATTAQATANGVGALLALTTDLPAGGSAPGTMLPMTGTGLPGYPPLAPPIGPTQGPDRSTFDVVTPLPASVTVNPFSLTMGPRLFVFPQPYIPPPSSVDVTITATVGILNLTAGTHVFTEDFTHTVGILNLTAGTHVFTETFLPGVGVLNLTAGVHTFTENFTPSVGILNLGAGTHAPTESFNTAVGILNLSAGTHSFTEDMGPSVGILNLTAGAHVITGASSSYQFVFNPYLTLRQLQGDHEIQKR